VNEGTIYLLHFARPYGHARHYLGWTNNLERRLHQHREGLAGAGRLPQVFHAAGIPFELARTWEGDRNRERALKRQGGHSRKCPLCGVKVPHA
jgi:predicted GIY-YIG superfamily endonuclease